MRQDVKRIAAEAATLIDNKLSLEMIYEFFMDVCKAEKIRPNQLRPKKDGNFLVAGNNSRISIEPVHFPESVRKIWTEGNEIDYESLILVRQEAITE